MTSKDPVGVERNAEQESEEVYTPPRIEDYGTLEELTRGPDVGSLDMPIGCFLS